MSALSFTDYLGGLHPVACILFWVLVLLTCSLVTSQLVIMFYPFFLSLSPRLIQSLCSQRSNFWYIYIRRYYRLHLSFSLFTLFCNYICIVLNWIVDLNTHQYTHVTTLKSDSQDSEICFVYFQHPEDLIICLFSKETNHHSVLFNDVSHPNCPARHLYYSCTESICSHECLSDWSQIAVGK